MQNNSEIFDLVRALAEEQGLTFWGIAALGPEADFRRYRVWLDQGRHGDMAYLEQHLELRADPRLLLPGARAAILVGLAYYQGDHLPRPGEPPRVAQYARLQDYHKVIWRKGEVLLTRLHARLGVPEASGRVVTDSAPLLERALAARAGGGFIGKNTCFIHPRQGSFYLLGELLTSLELPTTERPPPAPERRGEDGGCGSCRRCQVHCPTGALDQDYSIDARRCLAYWTIENRGTIPEEFWPWLGRYVFGCDICQLVCPYNRKAQRAPVDDLVKVVPTPPLFEVATLTQERYERLFGGTPLTRARRHGLMRNGLIALAVTGDPRLQEALGEVEARPEGGVVAETVGQIRRWLSARTAGPAG